MQLMTAQSEAIQNTYCFLKKRSKAEKKIIANSLLNFEKVFYTKHGNQF